MAELIYKSADIHVYDDVLSPEHFEGLFRYLNGVQYTSVHDDHWHKVWRLHDGHPLKGKASWYRSKGSASSNRASDYPTNSGMDPLVRWIADQSSELECIVGAEGAWDRFSYAPWIYPAGSGLSLHEDGVTYTGAFTYFAHKRWNLHWGGYLMVLDSRTRSRSHKDLWPSFLSDDHETDRVFDPGLAQVILPKPNRIVFISASTPHLLTRVDINAGQAARISVAGFFHKPPSGAL